jgi:hypothetical protein
MLPARGETRAPGGVSRGSLRSLSGRELVDALKREPARVPVMSEADRVTSIRQAAAACNVTPSVVRRWLFLGLIPGPPWTLQQLHRVRGLTDTEGRRRAALR